MADSSDLLPQLLQPVASSVAPPAAPANSVFEDSRKNGSPIDTVGSAILSRFTFHGPYQRI